MSLLHDALHGVLFAGEPTGIRPVEVDGALWFTQTWAYLLAPVR
jgi:hypothetical protein